MRSYREGSWVVSLEVREQVWAQGLNVGVMSL